MNLLEQLEAVEKERDALRLQLREAEKKVINVFANRAVIEALRIERDDARAAYFQVRQETNDLRKELADWKESVAFFGNKAGELTKENERLELEIAAAVKYLNDVRQQRNDGAAYSGQLVKELEQYREIIRKVWEIFNRPRARAEMGIGVLTYSEIGKLVLPVIKTETMQNEQSGANLNTTTDSGHFVPKQD